MWSSALVVAVQCARRALEADSKHFKSFLRAATAASKLREWTLVQRLCAAGLNVEPDNEDLVQLQEVRPLRVRNPIAPPPSRHLHHSALHR